PLAARGPGRADHHVPAVRDLRDGPGSARLGAGGHPRPRGRLLLRGGGRDVLAVEVARRGARQGGLVGWAMGLLLAAGGCATIEGELPSPVPRPPTQAVPQDGWLAGAAEIDVTPPPGYAMAGHSFEGAVALGVWTRLRAQALYVEDARGVPLVLVVGDLWAVEPGLLDRVAQRLHEHPGMQHVGREHLVIAATHTHHGPGLYSTSRTYSAFAAPEGGHDPGLFEALAARLAAAIAEAAAAR